MHAKLLIAKDNVYNFFNIVTTMDVDGTILNREDCVCKFLNRENTLLDNLFCKFLNGENTLLSNLFTNHFTCIENSFIAAARTLAQKRRQIASADYQLHGHHQHRVSCFPDQ